ncbi:MAG: pyridoxamine 5'-phosphate oxidase family protein [Alphaproteobacteria bacterium]
MTARFAEIAFTESIKKRQETAGSRGSYENMAGKSSGEPDALGEAEQAFIGMRDSFYMASVTSDGWPYVQHRGGPRGFLKIVDSRTLAFADFTGNKQYISAGNVDDDDRMSLFLMDYPNQRRLKIMGRARTVEKDDVDFPADLIDTGYDAPVERAWLIDVAAFDWNCPKYITPRFTEADISPAVDKLMKRIHDLEAQLELAAYSKPQ